MAKVHNKRNVWMVNFAARKLCFIKNIEHSVFDPHRFRTHAGLKALGKQIFFLFFHFQQRIYEQFKHNRGCDFKSQGYSSVSSFVWLICTHTVCQGKGRSQWRRISAQRSAKRSLTPPLWFCNSDMGCGGKRSTHVPTFSNSDVIYFTSVTSVCTVVTLLAWKVSHVT